ncbi:unnamed protein product [Musa banksii]
MEFPRKVPTLVELCLQTAISNLRYIGDVGEVDLYLLKDILPHCNIDQLTHIEDSTQGRDLSPVTDALWKRFYEQQFGVESANTVIKRMKQKKIVFKWRQLFEAKTKEREEAQNKMGEKLKQRYAETQAKKQSRQIQICSKIPPSAGKRSYWGGSGPSSMSNVKGNLMKKAKLEYLNSHEAKVHALMRRNASQQNSLSQTSLPRSTRQNNFLQSNSASSLKNGKPVARKNGEQIKASFGRRGGGDDRSDQIRSDQIREIINGAPKHMNVIADGGGLWLHVSRNIEGSTPPSRDSSLTHAARERVRKAPLLPHRAQTTLSLLSHYRRSDGNEGEEEEGEMVIPLSHLLLPPNPRSSPPPPDPYLRSSPVLKKWRIGASSAAPGVDLKPLETAIAKKDSVAVKEILDQLNQIGWAKKWSSQPYVSRRMTSLRELTTLGIKNAENLAIPSVRNDAAFLFTVVGTTSLLAVIAGQLPGDWGFFVPYLIGSISLIVLAVGSISPGLLQAAINGFSSFFPDYQERIARHEAAHFLVAYLIGLPILGYSLDIGKEHVNLVDERLQKLLYSGQLDEKELDRLAAVSMAGLAAEGLKYDKVIGQSADLFTLQRFINRSKPRISKEQQQNLTRWAVLFAGSLLKNNAVEHQALMAAMSRKAGVLECIEAIENAA